MKLSEAVKSPAQWYLAVEMAGGDLELAKSLIAIGYHETNMGRTPGYGEEGYELGVGAWGGGQPELRGLATQYEWTLKKLRQKGYALMSEEECIDYGQSVQKPSAGGAAWGRSVYRIRRDLVVDLPVPQNSGNNSVVAESYGRAPEWMQYAILALLAFAGVLSLAPKRE